MKAVLALEDGTLFYGTSIGISGEVTGEIVFNTGMMGYQEVLTDPSNYGLIVTMTYPLIGNYGIKHEGSKSDRPYVRGLVVRELCKTPSSWACDMTLDDYLKKHNIIGIEGIDTRALTRIIRDKGAMNGMISTHPDFKVNDKIETIKAFNLTKPASNVAVKDVVHYKGEGLKVAVIDYGIKQNILRALQNRECDVYLFPAFSLAEEILAVNPDGIVLSNGPGDPKDYTECIEAIKKLVAKKPVFGICLGHLLIALANGADTEKLKFGHRGCNYPVKDIKSDSIYITSQNHGYGVIENSLDTKRIEVTHRNMNDGAIEGLKYTDMPVFTVQFYPEVSPNPKDTEYLFDDFLELMAKSKGKVM